MHIKLHKIVLSALIAFALVSLTQAQEAESPSAPSNELIAEKLDELERGLQQVRQGQLNYQIERDLLKETYSSNLQAHRAHVRLRFRS